ncbi:MAG: lipopolysaccharide heptosyltransferase II [Nitrospirales bacterium]|nr:lipopolysaccharide heptosyltransferase II [Nitrospirales bacterium]
MDTSEKILIRSVNWLGDAVMTIPAIKAIRTAVPGAEISLLARPSVGPVFESAPYINALIPYGEELSGPWGKVKLAFSLRKQHFSKAFLLQNAFDAALVTALAGIPGRVGYNRDGRGFLLTQPVPYQGEDRKIHHIDYYLNLLSLAGIPINLEGTKGWKCGDKTMGALFPWIPVSQEEKEAARQALSGFYGPILGLNPGAAFGSAKRWLPDRFAEIAAWFLKDSGGRVILFGGKNETATAGEIERLVFARMPEVRDNNAWINLAGKTSLRELISLISECDLLLSNDSGPMHLAYAVGTPVVAVFGSTSPELTGPVGDSDRVITSGVRCSPCFKRVCKDNDLICMYGILSEDVYFGIKELLPRNKAVFFDRDGTLCRDAHYLNSWDNFEVFPWMSHLSRLKNNGYHLIGVSNQSGISRGLVDEAFVGEVNNLFMEKYGFDDFFYCPHHPDDFCGCRKPEPGMLSLARARHRIDLRGSWVVGDKDDDMLLAKRVGAKAVLVQTGKQQTSPYADFVAPDLKAVVDLILRDGKA